MRSTAQLRAEFDSIASAESDRVDHNAVYHSLLLSHVPKPCASALDLGCGTGRFTRLLAAQCEHVLGLDLSEEMVGAARARSANVRNVRYETGDILERDLAPSSFDCIVSIATMHHLPLEKVLPKIRTALSPGGVLVVLDLYRPQTFGEHLFWAAGMPAGLIHHLIHGGQTAQERQAWEEHGKGDQYLTLSELRSIAGSHLPGARIRRHMLWRYSLVWRKPD